MKDKNKHTIKAKKQAKIKLAVRLLCANREAIPSLAGGELKSLAVNLEMLLDDYMGRNRLTSAAHMPEVSASSIFCGGSQSGGGCTSGIHKAA